MKIYDLSDNELNQITLKKRKKNSREQNKLNEMKITKHEQNQKFN